MKAAATAPPAELLVLPPPPPFSLPFFFRFSCLVKMMLLMFSADFIFVVSSLPFPYLSSGIHGDGFDQARMRERAATLVGGIQDTEGYGSLNDPNILELASVQELAAMEEDLSIMSDFIKQSGGTFYLEQTRDLTIFMPTNAAFENAELDVRKLPWEQKWNILTYHIIPNAWIQVEKMNPGKTNFTTWEGQNVTIEIVPRETRKVFLVNDVAKILGNTPAIENFNGIMYKIDSVLIPPDMNVEELRQHVAEVEAQAEKNFNRTNNNNSSSSNNDDDDVKISSQPNFLSSKNETPQFVLETNRAHSLWKQTPEQRNTRLRVEHEDAANQAAAAAEFNSDIRRKKEGGSMEKTIGFLSQIHFQDVDGDGIDDDSDASIEAKKAISAQQRADRKIANHLQKTSPKRITNDNASSSPSSSSSSSATKTNSSSVLLMENGLLSSGKIKSLALLDQGDDVENNVVITFEDFTEDKQRHGGGGGEGMVNSENFKNLRSNRSDGVRPSSDTYVAKREVRSSPLQELVKRIGQNVMFRRNS